MRRREFIALIGVAASPVAPCAQTPAQARRVGLLMPLGVKDEEGQARIAAFVHALQQLGWVHGQNVRIDARFGTNNADIRKHASDLVALTPDAIVANGDSTVSVLLQTTRTIPVVFANVPDPVGAGFVDSMARPGGNATGFVNFEYGIGAKWLELLKQVAP